MSEFQVFLLTSGITLVTMVVLVILERKFPYTPGLAFFREGFWQDFVWYSLIQSFLLQIVIFHYVIEPIDAHFHLSRLHLLSDWPLVVQLLFFLVVHDFYIYWFHRWQHSSKILWRIHEAHHSGKAVDWLAGSRSHSLEILINQTIEFAPIVLLGADPLIVPIKACIDAVWGMYIHSNINVKAGRLQYFLNGPQMHQWHHADSTQVYFANFSTKFAFWDWLFGTAHLPKDKPVKFGLAYAYPKDYFLQHLALVWRLNERRLRKKRFFRWYFGIRPWFFKKLNGLLVRRSKGEKQIEFTEAIPTVE
jgi:sterol desaturase/sphingolipid hydroxylase (fatty acid hydroxylase superfamily)